MASNLLRIQLSRAIQQTQRMRLSTSTRILGGGGFAGIDNRDPNIDHDVYESIYTPIPNNGRTIKYTGEMLAIKEKEAGDWKNMTVDEQMSLYNSYFNLSMADMVRGSDRWKSVFGFTLVLVGMTFLAQVFLNTFITNREIPYTLQEEYVAAATKKLIQAHDGPLTGYSAMWDYENNCWKK